jgi:hypothetical protein
MKALLTPIALFGFLAVYATPAPSRILCEEEYQLSGGAFIATPYCQDEYLAKVARERGMNVSGASVRNDPAIKEDACRKVGYNLRVRVDCPTFRGD